MGYCVDQEMANSQRGTDIETEAARQFHYIEWARLRIPAGFLHIPAGFLLEQFQMKEHRSICEGTVKKAGQTAKERPQIHSFCEGMSFCKLSVTKVRGHTQYLESFVITNSRCCHCCCMTQYEIAVRLRTRPCCQHLMWSLLLSLRIGQY